MQILGLLLHTTAANAQRKTPEEKATRFTDEMGRVILLDSLCRSRVYEVNVWLSKSFDSLYATRPDPETKRKAYIYFFRSRDSLFRGILNREQFLRYDDWQREQRLKRQEEKRRENEKQKEGAMHGTTGEQPLKTGFKAYQTALFPQMDIQTKVELKTTLQGRQGMWYRRNRAAFRSPDCIGRFLHLGRLHLA